MPVAINQGMNVIPELITVAFNPQADESVMFQLELSRRPTKGWNCSYGFSLSTNNK